MASGRDKSRITEYDTEPSGDLEVEVDDEYTHICHHRENCLAMALEFHLQDAQLRASRGLDRRDIIGTARLFLEFVTDTSSENTAVASAPVNVVHFPQTK